MKRFSKMLIGITTSASLFSFAAVNSFAATADLPDAFSDLLPIIETVLKIVEFISKIFSFLS